MPVLFYILIIAITPSVFSVENALVENRCLPCHGQSQGKENQKLLLEDLKLSKKDLQLVLERLSDKADMPPLQYEPEFQEQFNIDEQHLKNLQLSSKERQNLIYFFKSLEPHIETLKKTNEVNLESEIKNLFGNKCSSCHTDGNYTNKEMRKGSHQWKGINYLNDLVEEYYDPSCNDYKSQEIYEILLSKNQTMPKKNSKQGSLTAVDKQTIEKWIKEGCEIPPRSDLMLSNLQLHAAVLNDLKSIKVRDRKYYRYFTISNLLHSNAQKMELFRYGLVKFINSISTHKDLHIPVVIPNTHKTVYRVDIRRLNWRGQTWNELMMFYPYQLLEEKGDLSIINMIGESPGVIVRADWFVYAASQEPFYSRFLGQPKILEQLERHLGVNRFENIKKHEVVRVGFSNSGISKQNRIIERHNMQQGYYWLSYDFKASGKRNDIFDYPLGPHEVSDESFIHHGGELIYSLPNGLQAYFLTDKDGEAIDIAPNEIVYDQSNLF